MKKEKMREATMNPRTNLGNQRQISPTPGRAALPLVSIRNLRRSFRGWRQRSASIRDMGPLVGEIEVTVGAAT